MNKAPKGRNLAGIIPLSGKQDTFDFPWPDYLQPLREGFLAVERSVYECAYAGCDSIWIVCNDDVSGLVRERIGDYVMSPKFFDQKDFVKNKDYHEHWVPVFYTPVLQKDRDRRDSLGWSVLHGSLSAFLVSDRLSSWANPTKYFASFPQGIYDPTVVKSHRDAIRGPNSFSLSYKGQTVSEGLYLSFTFFPEQWAKFKHHIKNQCTGGSRSIPFEKRWSSRHFTLDKIFDNDILSTDKKVEISEYYDLDSWESLRSYYISDMKIPRPTRKFMKPYIFKGGLENEQS